MFSNYVGSIHSKKYKALVWGMYVPYFSNINMVTTSSAAADTRKIYARKTGMLLAWILLHGYYMATAVRKTQMWLIADAACICFGPSVQALIDLSDITAIRTQHSNDRLVRPK